MRILHLESVWVAAGVVLLFAIWWLRPQQEKKAVPSLWLWKLSERFHARRMPLHRMKRLLQYLLQLLAVLILVLLAIQPVFRTSGTGRDYVAVVDVSASMMMEDHLEEAKKSLLKDAAACADGTSVTVITAGKEASVALDGSSNRHELENAVRQIETDWSTADHQAAAELVQRVLDRNPDAEVVWYTDGAIASDQITVRLSDARTGWNAAVSDLTVVKQGVISTFQAQVVSYGAPCSLTCALYLDDRIAGAKQLELAENEQAAVSWEVKNASFTTAKVVFAAQDALGSDNEALLTAPAEHSIRLLLCSDEPYFWQSALRAFDTVSLQVRGAADWDETFEGYDIYVFDHALPKVLPEDGSIWMIDPDRLPRETGLIFGSYSQGGYLELNRGNTGGRLDLSQALITGDIMIQKLHQVQDTERFEVALTAGGYPVLLAMHESNGLTKVVMPFALKDSNLPLTSDFILILGKLLEYTMPSLLPVRSFDAGETVQAAVMPLTKEIYLKYPDGTMKTLPFTSAGVELRPVQPGVYTLMQVRENGTMHYADFVCHIPGEESDPRFTETRTVSLIRNQLTPEQAEELSENTQRMKDIGQLLAALLAVFLLLEWMVYYHEQY